MAQAGPQVWRGAEVSGPTPTCPDRGYRPASEVENGVNTGIRKPALGARNGGTDGNRKGWHCTGARELCHSRG